jgi:hypothetical protein
LLSRIAAFRSGGVVSQCGSGGASTVGLVIASLP